MPAAKSKKKILEEVAAATNETVSNPVVEAEPKKKSKKQPKVVAVVTPHGIEGSFLPEPRKPLIARLQINSTDIQFNDAPLFCDPVESGQPEPYNTNQDSVFAEVNEGPVQEQERVDEPQQKTEVKASVTLETFAKCDLMMEYRECRDSKKIPERTSIACFWCAHNFSWRPCVIPEREEKGVYRIYGNFCSPSCAMAFLLNESLDTHVRWERIALLHRLYASNYKSHRIFPAPTRESLKHFGGPLSIEEFRHIIEQEKIRIDIQVPPMVSILGSIDTKPIDFYDSSMKHTISPLLGEFVPKAEEGLRLKRSRPLKEKDSTLDSVLKIQVKGRG
jgi:hypothetical protein